MKLPHAEELIKVAQKKERELTTSERRHCISFLMGTHPDLTNSELAELFVVSERTVRFDKQTIREDYAKLVKQEDIGLVISDIKLNTERLVREIQKSRKSPNCKSGSPIYLRHIEVEHQMFLKTVEALQNLGYYPKNMGHMTIDKFEYKAVVNKKDGSVDTRRIDMFDDVIDAEVIQRDGQDANAIVEPLQLAASNENSPPEATQPTVQDSSPAESQDTSSQPNPS